MSPNNNGVTTDLSCVDEVNDLLDHAAHVEEVIEALSNGSDRSLNAKISDAHKELGITFKRADILSNLAIADALDRLADHLAPKSTFPLPLPAHYLADLAAGDPHR